mgnify:FL=1
MRKDLATRLRFAGAAVLTVCFAPPSFAQAPPEPPPPSVVVETVRPHDVTDQSTYLGRVEAIDKVTIRARVDGFLASRGFDEGSEVKKDQILFTLEKEPYEAAVALARANLASARAGLDLAQATYDRTRPLAERGTSSQAALDDAAAKLSQARATVQAQEAMLRQAELNLSYTEIRAPMDGRTGRATYAVGEYVGPSSNPLVNLVRQDPMYVAFPVPQRILLEVRREGVTADQVLVRLSLPDGSTYQHDGAIKFIDVESNRGTDTTMVRAEMPNPERLLVDQQIVRVNVVSKETDHRLMISQAAIVLDQEGSYVLAVSAENKVEIRRIEVGAQHGARIEVRKGLSEGDRVIVSGHQKVRPGIVVEPSEAVNDAMLQETSGQAAP